MIASAWRRRASWPRRRRLGQRTASAQQSGCSTPRALVLDDEIPVALRGRWRRKNPVGGWCYFTTTTRTTRSHDDRPSARGGAVRVRFPRGFRPRDVPARLSAPAPCGRSLCASCACAQQRPDGLGLSGLEGRKCQGKCCAVRDARGGLGSAARKELPPALAWLLRTRRDDGLCSAQLTYTDGREWRLWSWYGCFSDRSTRRQRMVAS